MIKRCQGGRGCPMRLPAGKWHRHAEPPRKTTRRKLTPAEARFLGAPEGTTVPVRKQRKPLPATAAWRSLLDEAMAKHGPVRVGVGPELYLAVLERVAELATQRHKATAAAGGAAVREDLGRKPRGRPSVFAPLATEDDFDMGAMLQQLATLQGARLERQVDALARRVLDPVVGASDDPNDLARVARTIRRQVQRYRKAHGIARPEDEGTCLP